MAVKSNSGFGVIELNNSSEIEAAWELYKTSITDSEANIEALHEEFVDSFKEVEE